MNKRSKVLMGKAREWMVELSRHPVLSTHWDEMSLVVLGSTARGNADRYSDIDLVFYCFDDVKTAIFREYRDQGLTNRTDGIFVVFPGGHYSIASCEHLLPSFVQKNFISCWNVEHAIPLHDPEHRFAQLVKEGQRQLFQSSLDIVKQAYFDLQLTLNWMQMPINRGDKIATLLHATKIGQCLCRTAYLLDRRSYPPDKWLVRYLDSTRFGRANGSALRSYFRRINRANRLVKHRPFTNNPLYREAAAFIGKIAQSVNRRYGDQPWLGERWYDHL